MSEVRNFTPREQELITAIGDTGIGLHRGGMNWDPLSPTMDVFSQRLTPMVAIWPESEVPTPEEVESIVQIGKDKLKKALFHPSEIQGLSAPGANMATLFKRPEGTWTFRRMTWSVGPMWFPKPGTLEEIKEQV